MKILLQLLLIVWLASCKKNEIVKATPTSSNNTSPIMQDNRLLGGWRLDSMQWGTQMSYSVGNGVLTDSIHFSYFSWSLNSPVTGFEFFHIDSNVVTPLPDAYFWDTSTSDSLFFRVGNHSQDASFSFKFFINGNKLILQWSDATLDPFTPPPNPRVATSYYHQ